MRLLLAEVPYEGLMMSPRTLSHICGSKESRPAWMLQHKLKSARDMFASNLERLRQPRGGQSIVVYETLAALRYTAFQW